MASIVTEYLRFKVTEVFSEAATKVKTKASELVDAVKSGASSLMDKAKGAWGKLFKKSDDVAEEVAEGAEKLGQKATGNGGNPTFPLKMNLQFFASKSDDGAKSVRPEVAVTGSKKHGVNWKEGLARAKSTGNPQGQWAVDDLDYATEMANTLDAGESAYFDLPEGSQSIVYMPDGTTQSASKMWIRNNGTGTWHGYPMP